MVRARWVLAAVLAGAGVVRGELPRVDRCRVVYQFETGTVLSAGRGADLVIDREPRVWNAGARERYTRRELPAGDKRVRAIAPGQDPVPTWPPLEGVDARGRAWIWSTNTGQSPVTCIDYGKVERWNPDRGNASIMIGDVPAVPRRWPVVGHQILEDKEGAIWWAGKDRVYRKVEETISERLLPVVREPWGKDLIGEGTTPCWKQQLYKWGDDLWLVRAYYSNCVQPGSIVVRIPKAGEAEVVLRVRSQYVTGLVQHEGDVWAMVEGRESSSSPDRYTPASIWRIPVDKAVLPTELEVWEKIRELDSDNFKVRQKAAEYLKSYPAIAGMLKVAVKEVSGAEQKVRLAEILDSFTKPWERAREAELHGIKAGRLILMDSRGRQYVREWRDGAEAELILFEEKRATRVAVDKSVVIDCEGDDGRIWGHDDRFVYELAAGGVRLRAVAELGDLAGQAVKVLGARKGFLCLGVKRDDEYTHEYQPVWLDLARPAEIPVLRGEVLSTGMADLPARLEQFPVATGPGRMLWFARHKPDLKTWKQHTTQLCRVKGGEVEELGEEFVTGQRPTVWPLGEETAMVMTEGGTAGGVLWHDGGKTKSHGSMKAFIEARHGRLMEVMRSGDAFACGEYYSPVMLARMGDGLFVCGEGLETFANGSSTAKHWGVFRDGQWETWKSVRFGEKDELLSRIFGLDVTGGRILTFGGDYRSLTWFAVARDARAQTLETRERQWAFQWMNYATMPRYSGAWLMSENGARMFEKIYDQRSKETTSRGDIPEMENEYLEGDFRGVRRWDLENWREIKDAHFYGSAIWEDRAGGVWQFRVREAEVIYADGRRQFIPLDAGIMPQYRLEAESKRVVWVASAESLRRFELRLGWGGKGEEWAETGRWRLPRFGAGFYGPWIVGDRIYWVSGGGLCSSTVNSVLRSR